MPSGQGYRPRRQMSLCILTVPNTFFEQNPIHSGNVLYGVFSLLVWNRFVRCGEVFSAAEYHIRYVRCQDAQRGKNSTEII